jgi:F-type H+-transporting ATPase subunit a
MSDPMPLMTHLLAASSPVDHVTDKALFGWYFSNVTLTLIVASVLTLLIIIPAARRIAKGNAGTLDDVRTQGKHANLVEFVCVYLRDEVFHPLLGDQTDKYVGVLWSFFWFILICNLLGLLPLVDLTGGLARLNHGHGIWATATQSIYVTGALAFVAFAWWTTVALIKDPIGYFKHLTAGAPWYIWPIIVPVEILSTFIKPIALAIRLFANMSGGHILLATLFTFVPALIAGLGTVGYVAGILPLLGAVAVYMLEILVAFIQAFIFAFLTGLFLSQLVAHHDHDDHGEHPHDEQVHHPADPPAAGPAHAAAA